MNFAQAMSVITYLAVLGNVALGTFLAALPAGVTPPWWVGSVAATINALVHAMPSDGLPLPTKAVVKAMLIASLGYLAVSLMACSTPAISQVDAFAVTLGTLETAATAYESEPKADPAIVAKMKTADQQAFVAIKTAEASAKAGASPDLIAIQTALSTFQALIPPQFLQPKAK